MKIIGLAGNIGSGKSLAASYLQQLGAGLIDADKIGHMIIEPGGAAYNLILQAFGSNFCNAEGYIDRRRLGKYIFADESGERRQRLNDITHPLIVEEIRRQIELFHAQDYEIIIIEAALLFSTELAEMTHENWLIVAPEELLLSRVTKRDVCDLQTAKNRLSAQAKQDDLKPRAQRVIINDGTVEDFFAKLRQAYADIKAIFQQEK